MKTKSLVFAGIASLLGLAALTPSNASTLIPIPSYVDPNGGTTSVLGINNAGWMTGTISYGDNSSVGFSRDAAGVYTTFSYPGGFSTIGRAIGNSNAITGYSTDNTLNMRTDAEFLRAPGGTITTLTNPTDSSNLHGIAQGMNSAGVIVGDYFLPGPPTPAHGYILNGASFTDLTIAGARVAARGITDLGTVVGWATNGPFGDQGFIYSGGVYQFFNDPNPLAVGGTTFEDINNNGLIVGEWFDASLDSHAFEYDSNTNSFLDINVPGATNAQAFGVNDFGQVVITTDIASGPNNFIFDASAVPEPALWAMMLVGFFGVGTMMRTRRSPVSAAA